MHIDPYIVLGSAIIGFLVGMTGAGGGALMTPMLILLFGVTPSAAISSDLVAAVVMRPIGAGVHLRRGTVNLRRGIPAAPHGPHEIGAGKNRGGARCGAARRSCRDGASLRSRPSQGIPPPRSG